MQQLLQLRLVCKACNDVHASQLYHLSLGRLLQSDKMPFLLAWLRSSTSPIHALEVKCTSPAIEGLSETLACLQTPLMSIDIALRGVHTQKMVQLVSAFSNLNECTLTSENRLDTSLALLGLLPHLQVLTLSGRFCCLHSLAHLTRLCLYAGSSVQLPR